MLKGAIGKEKAIALMVDEIQTLAPGEGAKEALKWLHLGNHGMPIVALFGGLAHSGRYLEETHQLARIEEKSTLARFSEEETLAAAQVFFAHFAELAVPGLDRDGQALEAAQRSEGWPMHLDSGLRGIAGEWVQALDAGDAFDPAKAWLAADARRRDYYHKRLGDLPPELVHSVFGMLPKPGPDGTGGSLSRVNMSRLLCPALAEWIAGGDKLPADAQDEESFLGRMIRLGLVQENAEGNLNCPIPSLRRYAGERAAVDVAQRAQLQIAKKKPDSGPDFGM